nr:ribosome-binding factor A-like [Nerophis lumbriciformis]
MQADFSRADRVAGQLRREIAQLIWAEINDPRLGPVSVTDVEVTRDLAHAKVYLASQAPETVAESLKVLKHAAGFLRRRLGKMLRLRAVPELHFKHDDSIERGAHLSELINQAVAEDSSHPHDEEE